MTKKIFGVLGLGIFGRTIVEELSKYGDVKIIEMEDWLKWKIQLDSI